MKKDGQGFSVTVWSAIALGAVGIGIVVAFVAGFFLGHFTGHSETTTVGAITAPAEAGGESEGGEGAGEEEAEGGEQEEAEGEEEARPEEEEMPEGAMPEEEAQEGEEGGEGAAAGGAGSPEAGAEVFAEDCAVCHGPDGHGGSGGPDLRTMPKAKTESGAIEQVTNGGGGMPPFGEQLSEEEIKDVAAYVVEEIVGGG